MFGGMTPLIIAQLRDSVSPCAATATHGDKRGTVSCRQRHQASPVLQIPALSWKNHSRAVREVVFFFRPPHQRGNSIFTLVGSSFTHPLFMVLLPFKVKQ